VAEDIAGLAERLVAACEDDSGSTPQRIIIEPNGEIEVNVRVGYRDQTHPEVYFRPRRKVKR
jgi:hypothetical protein